MLNYYTWPSQMFYCNSPIKGLADIKGRKVRVQGTSQGDLVEALGATGVTIPFAEVVPALQRGTSIAASPAPCPHTRLAGTR